MYAGAIVGTDGRALSLSEEERKFLEDNFIDVSLRVRERVKKRGMKI